MATIQIRIQSALLAASVLLSLASIAYSDINVLKQLPNGALLSYDLSYDTPDINYVASAPLSLPGVHGLYSADIGDNYILGNGFGGFNPVLPGLSALPPAASPIVLQKPIARGSFIRGPRGRRIRLFSI